MAKEPARPLVEPEQLPTLLDESAYCLAGRGRPMMGVFASTGLRIEEVLSLERRDINLARCTLLVRESKTETGRGEWST